VKWDLPSAREAFSQAASNEPGDLVSALRAYSASDRPRANFLAMRCDPREQTSARHAVVVIPQNQGHGDLDQRVPLVRRLFDFAAAAVMSTTSPTTTRIATGRPAGPEIGSASEPAERH
jgi:hypothetical protein